MADWRDQAARSRKWALEHRVQATIQRSIIIGLLGFAIFRDWRPGALGFVCAIPFCAWYWRPGGPGSRRVERDEQRGSGDP